MSSLAQGFQEIGASLSTRFSKLGMAAMRFKSKRIEYYEYLADLMADAGGRRNMIDMFRAASWPSTGRSASRRTART
jgi:hypothetical protein